MNDLVVGLMEIEETQLFLVGGKGLNLGILSRIDGLRVPEGFCVTTAGLQTVIAHNEPYQTLVERLASLTAIDRQLILDISQQIRDIIRYAEIPAAVVEEVTHYLSQYGEDQAYAVRSSATAEDLPSASFAGQYDSYLNIIGVDAILEYISKCWSSLFTERAVMYRIQNDIDHRQISLAVIVQRMVLPQASGILFTADPITSHRKVLSIDASFGLGEALVSGLVSADSYRVKDEQIIDKRIAEKQLAIYGQMEGGTETRHIPADQQKLQTLTDEQILQLARIGRQIEAHFDQPQDIEWCVADDTFYIVQSRPITTLYPIPEANDQDKHVYVSVGHQQMMTDAMKPLGLSFFLLLTPAPMRTAGGRLFVDISPRLASIEGREALMNTLGYSDPLLKDALKTIMEREIVKIIPTKDIDGHGNKTPPASTPTSIPSKAFDITIVTDYIKSCQAALQELQLTIAATSGTAVFDLIREDIQQLRKTMFDKQSLGAIGAAMAASGWINEKMFEWLGEKNAADTLTQSVPNNITSEMGLELLDVADVIRPYPEVIAYLQQVKDELSFNELSRLDGGQQTRQAIEAYLHKYGARCSGEIDITKTRWSERPAALVPMILSNIRNFELNESQRRFEQGEKEAHVKEQELLYHLLQLPDGQNKASETKQRIDLIRSFIGFREYPKYVMVQRYFVYKQALVKEAEQLVRAGVIHQVEDIYYLTFDELQETVRTHSVDVQSISKRKEEYKLYERLTPPRMITSEGEIINGRYSREHLPEDALAGLPVSAECSGGKSTSYFTH